MFVCLTYFYVRALLFLSQEKNLKIVLHLDRIKWRIYPSRSEFESPHQLLSSRGNCFGKGSERLLIHSVKRADGAMLGCFCPHFFSLGVSCVVLRDQVLPFVLEEAGRWQVSDPVFQLEEWFLGEVCSGYFIHWCPAYFSRTSSPNTSSSGSMNCALHLEYCWPALWS